MPYLVDTNVISETARKKPDPKVLAWIGNQPALTLPAVAIYELASGIQRLPPPLQAGCLSLKAGLPGRAGTATIWMATLPAKHGLTRRNRN